METRPDWAVLWDRAKGLEKQVVERKRAAQTAIAGAYPEVGTKRFGDLVRAMKAGKLRTNVARLVETHLSAIDAMEAEARDCREKSDKLAEELRQADKRTWLDPKVDPIPPGPYPKLRQCRDYPLRQDCNDGDNTTTRWRRCEFMKYDDSKSIFDSSRWRCTAAK